MTHAQAMAAPIVPLDRRTRAAIEQSVLENYALQGRIDWDWCNEIPSRAAAARRLVAAGRIRTERDESLNARGTRVVLRWLEALFA